LTLSINEINISASNYAATTAKYQRLHNPIAPQPLRSLFLRTPSSAPAPVSITSPSRNLSTCLRCGGAVFALSESGESESYRAVQEALASSPSKSSGGVMQRVFSTWLGKPT
jgi:hypothetical protein